ncbi:MAG: 1-phosphofructokinase [Sedimenticola sp.]
MIYTLTLNPAVDLELVVDDFEYDSVSRAVDSCMDYGGKGFNVSRMLSNLKTTSVAMGFVGGKSGERLDQGLRSLGISTDFNWIEGETRTNVSIVKAGSSQHLKVNELGPDISSEEVDALTDKVRQNAKQGDWWVLAGSLPPGVHETLYAELIDIIKGAGADVLLDTSSEALRIGCGANPTIIKPNMEEARELTALVCGKDASDEDVAQALLAMGPENIIISMGKDGALLASQNRVEMVNTPEVKERNPIGAGDSMVGGIVWGLDRGLTLNESLKCGIACGAATATQSGTTLGSREMVMDYLAQMESVQI